MQKISIRLKIFWNTYVTFQFLTLQFLYDYSVKEKFSCIGEIKNKFCSTESCQNLPEPYE